MVSRNVYTLEHRIWLPPVERVTLSMPAPDGVDPAWFCRRANRWTFGHQMPRRLRSRYAARPK